MKIIWTKILKFLNFLILKNFSKILEKFHFSISISRHFQFTFHSRSRFWDIFISLFTLDLDIKAFSFHFSFSKWVNQIFISLFTSRNEISISPLKLPISTLAGHWIGRVPTDDDNMRKFEKCLFTDYIQRGFFNYIDNIFTVGIFSFGAKTISSFIRVNLICLLDNFFLLSFHFLLLGFFFSPKKDYAAGLHQNLTSSWHCFIQVHTWFKLWINKTHLRQILWW